MLERSIYTAVSPEETAEVIYQDASRAEEAASSMRLTAHDCLEMGIIDRIVAEPPNGAHSDADEAARLLQKALVVELARLAPQPAKKRGKARYSKYRGMGIYSSRLRARAVRDVDSALLALRSGFARLTGRRRAQSAPEDDAADATLGNGHIQVGD